MKLSSIKIAQTSFLHLKGPDGAYMYDDGKPVGIDLYGPSSPQQAQVNERSSARVLKRLTDNEMKPTFAPSDEQRRDEADDLAAITAGFRNLEYDAAGAEALTGTALFTAVYLDPEYGWIKDQVNKVKGDWGKFLKPSSES